MLASMQAELVYRNSTAFSSHQDLSLTNRMSDRKSRKSKDDDKKKKNKNSTPETIHSGHFMVSDFDSEAQDDEDEVAVIVPELEEKSMTPNQLSVVNHTGCLGLTCDNYGTINTHVNQNNQLQQQQQQQQPISIETSLRKLFQCMSLAYR